jgi:hypothetical protein
VNHGSNQVEIFDKIGVNNQRISEPEKIARLIILSSINPDPANGTTAKLGEIR